MPRTKYQQPIEVNIPTVSASTQGDEALKILRQYGVVIIPLNTITTAERDALTASNGMLIYNSTLDKVQAREAGSWVSLT